MNNGLSCPKIFFCFMLVLIILSCSAEKVKKDSEVGNKVLTLSLKKTFDKKNNWLVDGATDSLEQIIYSNLYYGHSNCWVEDYSDFTTVDSLVLDYISIVPENLNVDVIGSTGIISGNGHFVGLYNQDTFDLNLCFIETYHYDKSWLLVARQSAKMKE